MFKKKHPVLWPDVWDFMRQVTQETTYVRVGLRIRPYRITHTYVKVHAYVRVEVWVFLMQDEMPVRYIPHSFTGTSFPSLLYHRHKKQECFL